MKKISIIISVFALIFCSCTKEQGSGLLTIDENNDTVSFWATFEGAGEPETKLGINTSTGALTWATDNAIAVEMTDGSFVQFVFDGEKFTASLSGKTVKDGGVAYYPATIAINNTPGSVSLPTSYTTSLSAGVATVCPPMKATVHLGDDHLELSHLGGILSVTVSHVPADATKLVLTATGKVISGTFAVSEGQIAADSGSDGTITVNFPKGGGGATEFFIPVPVTTFDSNFRIDFKNASDESLYTYSATRSSTKISVARASFTRMAELTVPVSVYINTTNIWWDDTNQYIYVAKPDDSEYYSGWPGTQFAVSSTKSFTHGDKSYYRVIEDLGSMSGKTAKVVVHRGYNNSSEYPYGDLYRATLSSVNLSNDVYISLTTSTDSSHKIFVSNWATDAYKWVKNWNGTQDNWYEISSLSTETLGDNDYHYFTTSTSDNYIKGSPQNNLDSWCSSESHIQPATGWDYFVKFTASNGNNLSAFIGFPAVVITKD